MAELNEAYLRLQQDTVRAVSYTHLMMDTILNLGLNDEAVEGLAKKTNNARFAYDCYRRFVQMFADVVMMVPKSL